MLVHNEVDTLRSRQRVVLLQRLNVFRTRQWTFLLGLNEEILTKVWHLVIAILFVKFDQIFQSLSRRTWSQPGKIFIQISFELVQQHLELGIVELAAGWYVSGIDQDRAKSLEIIETLSQESVNT